VGVEIQHYHNKEAADPRGESDHYILDAKKVIEAWVRGAKCITRPQIIKIITTNIPERVRQERQIPDAQTLLANFIQDGTLIPYWVNAE